MKNVATHAERYRETLRFLNKNGITENTKILDLGTENPFSKILIQKGYNVKNTQGENLDTHFHTYTDTKAEVVTAFEIFEHLFAPFNILSHLKTNKIVISIPLKLWFSSAYWNEKDDWDKHYHEFEIKQLNFLLEKTGWKIKDSEKWTHGNWKNIGFRTILRYFYPRYYIVYCEREEI